MTILEKAIKFCEREIVLLNRAPDENGCEMTKDWQEQLDIYRFIRIVLGKQVTKQPEYYDGDPDMPICPNCRVQLKEMEDCPCGQKIDWENAE